MDQVKLLVKLILNINYLVDFLFEKIKIISLVRFIGHEFIMDIFELSTIYCHEKFPSEIIIISYNILLVEELIFAHNFFIRYFMCTIKNKYLHYEHKKNGTLEGSQIIFRNDLYLHF